MTLPKLKRIRIKSEVELETWLSRNSDHDAPVMLVTHAGSDHARYVSRSQIAEALGAHGWVAGPRFTLSPTLIGHVIRPGAQ